MTTRFLLILSLVFLSVSCTSINKSHLNSSVGITISSPMEAKIDVDMTKKLVGYASGGYLFHLFKVAGDNKHVDGVSYSASDENGFLSFFNAFSKSSEVRSAAAYNAIRTSEADILINPQYVIEESNWNPFYKLIKVKVTGYPGKVISIKNRN